MYRLTQLLPLALVAWFLPAGQLSAQSGTNAPTTVSNGPTAYTVGAGDVLEIEVYDDPDLSGLFTIQHGGEISFPLLGDVQVDGLTVKEVRSQLTRLLEKDFLVNPQVSVQVQEHRSQWVTLVGEVVRPGKYYLRGDKSLVELLTEAGGFTQKASGDVLVSRVNGSGDANGGAGGGDNGSRARTIRVQLSPDQPPTRQKRALSLRLKSGDIVTVPSTQFFFISGEIKKPGSYPLTVGLTVLKGVSMAGGLTKFGGKSKVEILRKRPQGGTERIKVDLEDIERGKKPDILLEPEDIIQVGRRIF